jgi:hypothetical protein
MHKITDRCSVETQFSIPVPDESGSTAGDWLREPGVDKDQQPSETAPLDPLYLFACRLLWHKEADAAAAWELIHGLKSTDQRTRVVVSALLSKRKTAREIGVAQVRRIPFSPRCGS